MDQIDEQHQFDISNKNRMPMFWDQIACTNLHGQQNSTAHKSRRNNPLSFINEAQLQDKCYSMQLNSFGAFNLENL